MLHRISIQDLTIYLVILTALVSGAELTGVLPGLGDLSPVALGRGEWWNLAFYCFNLRLGPIWLFFAVYMMYIFGTALESGLGHARYTGFILMTIISVTATAVLLPAAAPPYYLQLAISLGCAFLFPDMTILLFFILPLRLKWVAILSVAGAVFDAGSRSYATQTIWPFVSLLIGMSGVLVFFVYSYVRGLGQQAASRVRVARLVQEDAARHRCEVCGRTELEDPTLDFRFCVECADHEYCQDHISNHQHQR